MRRNKSGGGFSHFISALLGAVIGGFVIYFLLGGAANNDNNIDKGESNPKQIESKENKESTKKDININADDSIESVVVKKSIDSVVGINTISEVTQNTFFGQQSGYVEGIGSGSIVTEDGYIVTNSHVVSNGDVTQINVLFSNGETSEAELVWNDAALDLAIIKVKKDNLPAIELGDSDEVGIGDKAIAIGNPLGFELQSTVTSGIISGLNRTVKFNTGVGMDGLMQTDAAINSGNSGGALLNTKGELIGINTAKAGNSDGIGFAIPINIVKPVIEKVRKTGKFNSVYLGITGQSVDYIKQIPNFNTEKLGTDEGVYVVSSFDKNSDIEEGDVITAIDGMAVKDMNSLRKALLSYEVGDKAKLTVYRDGSKKEIDVEFNIDSSNIDEFNEAQPSQDNNEERGGRLNPFFNLP
ncbi:MAG: trypsin-like peptidase domain-containing protein [Anaerococcus prevotii]|uniref:S1C family serine protease n=1 Tax=Anaerococcus prevotii TaxID=33034 RepID=UPI0028FF973A|nr:trypsin-like peptidase domain-containing protein [Anaerococcus prevotii]MDU2559103.1 trypsin-like peptidase domain-containing protein [Anaerococcus prevotii]MDU2585265.1 trypsin-like peptidase domain-containing protein [Anaerococcus prevotii]MDU3137283.1 trypsin-like peptidase domain-containing protein [Anaerococcus prevotii]